MHRTSTEACDLTADDDRLREIAGILAAGILRLRCRAALPRTPDTAADPENPPDSSLNRLELTRETRLSVMRVDEVREPQNGRKT
jgi:hypothetical protein